MAQTYLWEFLNFSEFSLTNGKNTYLDIYKLFKIKQLTYWHDMSMLIRSLKSCKWENAGQFGR